MLQYLSFVFCVALFPSKSMVPPVLCISASAASSHPMLCSPFVVFLCSFLLSYLYWGEGSALRLYLPLGLLCRPCFAPPAGHINPGFVFCFLFSAVSALFFSFPVFRLVLTCRPSVGPSPGHIIGLIVPANTTLSPRDSACALCAC